MDNISNLRRSVTKFWHRKSDVSHIPEIHVVNIDLRLAADCVLSVLATFFPMLVQGILRKYAIM